MSSLANDMRWTQRVVPPIWLLLALLISAALHHLVPIAQLLEPPARWLGLAPLALGVVLTSTGFRTFRRAGTPVVPFRRSTALVTWGVYRLTRNPMYLGLTLILAGAAWMRGSIGAFVPLPLLVWILQSSFIRTEERVLEEIFGGEYLRYKVAVRRWL
ncbi:MAG TPA: isoprenylcysteine carboxylmethyltransferase family protein [Steroidobacteraceae bacterium]|nr:isoprenylcysteine carboxylmethyltransferase family protein [Steroidobacteraceae bacterium]